MEIQTEKCDSSLGNQGLVKGLGQGVIESPSSPPTSPGPGTLGYTQGSFLRGWGQEVQGVHTVLNLRNTSAPNHPTLRVEKRPKTKRREMTSYHTDWSQSGIWVL